MTEIFEQLNILSIDELNQVIEKSQQLIQEKREEALRLARKEQDRRRQEEIAELQKRLRELQEEAELAASAAEPEAAASVQAEAPVQSVSASSKEDAPEQSYRMISCPYCHQLIQSDNNFCVHCGKRIKGE